MWRASNDQAGFRLGVERPDRALHLAPWQPAVVAWQRAVAFGVDDLRGDPGKRGVEMLVRLDHQDLALRRVNAEIREQVRAHRLRARGNQYSLDATHADRRHVSERHDGAREGLVRIRN